MRLLKSYLQALSKSSGEAEPLERAETKSLGFTLIELLTAVAVIGIVSAFVLTNLNTSKKQKDVQRAAQKLMLDIRKAQNLSLSPLSPNVCVYGLKVNSPTDYFIYRNDNDIDESCVAIGRAYNALGGSITEESIVIGDSIQVSNFAGNMDIAFEAPEPITFIGGAEAAGMMTITLSNSSCPTCASKNVVINRFGQVEMQ